jgi:hypothetical protein
MTQDRLWCVKSDKAPSTLDRTWVEEALAGFFPSPDGAAIIAAESDTAAFVAVGGVRADVGAENTVLASQLLLLLGVFVQM